MEFEDSRNALFCEPNAYIQNHNRKEQKKVVFSEPYECAPNFYINNNFSKKDCECVPKVKKEHSFDCEKNKQEQYNCNCNNHNKSNNNFFSGFNLQSLLPMLGLFNKGAKGGLDLANIMSLFGGKGENNMISNLLGNKDILANITSLFGAKKENETKKIQPTEIDIKNYTKVE